MSFFVHSFYFRATRMDMELTIEEEANLLNFVKKSKYKYFRKKNVLIKLESFGFNLSHLSGYAI